MENKEFFAALTDLVREKGINGEAFIETLENALTAAARVAALALDLKGKLQVPRSLCAYFFDAAFADDAQIRLRLHSANHSAGAQITAAVAVRLFTHGGLHQYITGKLYIALFQRPEGHQNGGNTPLVVGSAAAIDPFPVVVTGERIVDPVFTGFHGISRLPPPVPG